MMDSSEEKDSKQQKEDEGSIEKPTTVQEASSTDPPAKPIPKIKHPMNEFPETLAEFGYTFIGKS